MSWTKPTTNWFKLNTDGSSLGNPGRVSGGGLIEGCGYIARFIRNIGKAMMRDAEALRSRTYLLLEYNKQNTFASENNLKSIRFLESARVLETARVLESTRRKDSRI